MKKEGYIYIYSKLKGLFWKVKTFSLWERKTNMVTLGCFENKTNDFSFVVQYSLMEEGRRLEV